MRLLLIAIILLLGLVVAAEWLYWRPAAPEISVRQPPTGNGSASSTVKAKDYSLPPADHYQQIEERPLFIEGRRPVEEEKEPEAPAPPPAPPKPKTPAPAIDLRGIMIIGDERIALLGRAVEKDGPTRLRMALIKSRNLVSIRLLQSIGIRPAIKYLSNFGFDPKELSRDLSLALGSATMTPYKLAHGYSAFANGGYLVEPYFIERIEDAQGNVLFQAEPLYACEAEECPEKPLKVQLESDEPEESGAAITAELENSDEASDPAVGEVLAFGETGFVEMHVGVDGAGQDQQPGGVEDIRVTAQG